MEGVRQFVDEHVARFMKLDLDPFIGFLLKKAVKNRMVPYANIRKTCQKAIAYIRSSAYRLKIYPAVIKLQIAVLRPSKFQTH